MLPLLETERLVLRPIGPADVDPLHALWTQPGVRRWLFDDETIPRARVAEEVETSRRNFAAHGVGLWAATLRDGSVGGPAGELAGFCGFRHFHEPPELQLLYGVADALAGRGLAAEAARAAIRFAFEERGFARVAASADAPNVASIRVMEKAGLRCDKRVTVHGLDTVFYAVPRAGWSPTDEPYALLHP
jgi:[ribosomal protein S5]-alanine N-acetyltransferase